MPENISILLETATHAAHQAGDLLTSKAEDLFNVNFQDATDVKLQADEDSEALIRKILESETDYPVIGEEQGGDAELLNQNTPYWVVDPLDGTYNYFRNLPVCCVSIGLCSGQTPILGVVHDFNTNITYTGGLQHGCFINGTRLNPQWAESIDQAALLTGFPAGRDYTTEALNKFVKNIQEFKKIRMIGSAALALTYVATGRADVYYEESTRLWDVAAGIAIARSAGAYVDLECVNAESFTFNLCVSGKEEWALKNKS